MSCASKLAVVDAERRSTRSGSGHSCGFLLPAPCCLLLALCSPARHEVYLVKLISFELSTGNNAKIIHRHHQYNQPSSRPQNPQSPANCCPYPSLLYLPLSRSELFTRFVVANLAWSSDFWQLIENIKFSLNTVERLLAWLPLMAFAFALIFIFNFEIHLESSQLLPTHTYHTPTLSAGHAF